MVCYGILWYVMVYHGLKSFPILWFHIPCIIIVCGTSHGAQMILVIIKAPILFRCQGLGLLSAQGVGFFMV